MTTLRQIWRDTSTLARGRGFESPTLSQLGSTFFRDGSVVLCLSRLRESARRKRIPLLGGALRRLQTVLFGVEISRDVTLGEGVVFLHTFGIVVGGDAKIGDRVVFLGSNTVGSVGTKGYPTIGNDVVIGAGARILGNVRVGDGASIGANAVVLMDVPAGATALGVPAVVREQRLPANS